MPNREDHVVNKLMALTLALIGEGAHLEDADVAQQLRAISDDPVILARAGGQLLGEFLQNPLGNPKGLQAAALLDTAGAGREVQAVVVEALNVRARLTPQRPIPIRTN